MSHRRSPLHPVDYGVQPDVNAPFFVALESSKRLQQDVGQFTVERFVRPSFQGAAP